MADNSANKVWLRALEATAPISRNPQRILSKVIEELAEVQGDLPALLSARESLTYGALTMRANRFARWALDQDLAKGDTVCLMMPNQPEYVAAWLGMTRIGIVVSLINTNLRGPSLAHCIDIAAPRHVIVTSEFSAEFHSLAPRLASSPKIWAYTDGDFDRIDRALERFSGERLAPSEQRVVTIADRALLIYTSGTTGLPKAANVSHRRLLEWSFWFAGLMNAGPSDRMYDCLPMYHSVGGVVAPGAVLVRGGSVLIREKFSGHQFWNDVCDWDCTLVQYIGELCRYLVNAAKSPKERSHRIRIFCGNGLRADVWEKFQERFAIPRILEFYASTEGNVSLYNVEGHVGAIGRVPSFLRHRFPLALVKFDAVACEPARDSNGYCIHCTTDEVGEAIGKIGKDPVQSSRNFEGYTAAKDSEQKILHNVFERGDAWYRTGDLMRMDAGGFFYFVDRVGDTFRWKGENVATSEVAGVIMAFPGIKEATVYGVHIPGTEGAGEMAAIVVDGQFKFAKFREHLAGRLPPYARPLFLRIAGYLKTTATFKHAKVDLVREGYDPAATSDPIYFYDQTQNAFVRLDGVLHARIQAGEVLL